MNPEWIILVETDHYAGFVSQPDGSVRLIREEAISIHTSYLEALDVMAALAIRDRDHEYGIIGV